MKTNITSRGTHRVFSMYVCLIIVIGMAFTAKLSAQCTLACKSEINVSVSEADNATSPCAIILTSEMLRHAQLVFLLAQLP